MGLLFKVEGVSATSSLYGSLSNLMLALCCGFIILWAVCVGLEMLARWRVLMGPLPSRGLVDGSDVVKPPRSDHHHHHHQHGPAAHPSGAGKGLWVAGPEVKELADGKDTGRHSSALAAAAAAGVVNGSPAHVACEDGGADLETQPLTSALHVSPGSLTAGSPPRSRLSRTGRVYVSEVPEVDLSDGDVLLAGSNAVHAV